MTQHDQHDEHRRPELGITLAAIGEAELAWLATFPKVVARQHGHERFCGWLQSVVEAEIERRDTDGELEPGSFPTPPMDGKLIGEGLQVCAMLVRSPVSRGTAKFADELQCHVLAAAVDALEEIEFCV